MVFPDKIFSKCDNSTGFIHQIRFARQCLANLRNQREIQKNQIAREKPQILSAEFNQKLFSGSFPLPFVHFSIG
ncbi:MAG: hypothetical protein UZ01_02663 [Candidatus Brocadia sinica]|nr:MAG: hypothetical protein UZ01_02663 [Candidatus Brocadia sinica]